MAEAIIELRQLNLTYQSLNGEIEALDDVNLTVEKGEFICVVGPSGCGKSTLLSIISGLLQPSSGQITVNGHPVLDHAPDVGYMLQKDYLFDWRTIQDNVQLGLEIQGKLTRENRAYVKSLLKTYGLYEFRQKYPQQLSGGMRQRAALIRTLATRPEILLLDEAFSSLDYQTRLAVTEDIYAIIKQENKTAILVTHDIAESISMADRIVVLTKRPGTVKKVHTIRLSCEQRTPITSRDAPEFRYYFNMIWKELDVHV
jgi:NitT/TauT family transport system ATP-binding protein